MIRQARIPVRHRPVGECEPIDGAEVMIGLFTHGSVAEEEERWAEFGGFRVFDLGGAA
jgi:hypothetical protein